MFGGRRSFGVDNRQIVIYDDDLFNDSKDNDPIVYQNKVKSKCPRDSNILRNAISKENGRSKVKLQTELKNLHCQSRYIIKKRIGRGTYGEVFKAIDRATNSPVAIKKVTHDIGSVSEKFLFP